ncbi:YdcF family protein [Bacillus benzoevorans]|uniref:Uncharacterized SAM-binding protein YcdF (DUF218 family) n=1 Tax=Bacillus benzoevorans TaxID=1456 RepID=A0A7X0HW98_9BACI|nr:YdcF family protein [Bacillus benzoevorans]MBB6447092.1 uncharacterized SAM-binding protein YcdF (DUF218 family) [Bacillus benzoevorans]
MEKNNQSKKQNLIYLILILIMILLLILFGKSFGVLFIIANLLAVTVIMYIKKTGNQKLKAVGRIITIAYSLFLLSFIMVEAFVISEMRGSNEAAPYHIDVVIILGAGLHGEKPSRSLETRLIAGTRYLKENQEIPVVVSGGQGAGETISEAEAMGRYLKKNGIAEDRIHYENQSTSTYENLKFSKQLLEELGVKEPTVLIVTNDFHIARTKIIAKEVGLKSSYLHAKSPPFVKINYLIREYFAFLKTWLLQEI